MENGQYFSMQWHVTDRCDQRCKHCYIFAGQDKHIAEQSIDVLLSILDNFEDCCRKMRRLPNLVITGGDPLLYPNIWQLLEVVHKKGIHFSILGNPFHLDSLVVAHLEELGCRSYQMSLDGLRETHDSIRMPGSFDATVQAIQYFKGRKMAVNIMATVSECNKSELPKLVKVVVEHNVNSFGFARYCPNPGDEGCMISPADYRDFLEQMWAEYIKYKDCGTRFALKDHLWKLFLYERGLFDSTVAENCRNIILDGCHCGITHITTLADGTVYACRRCKSPIGRVPESSFFDIFHSDAMDAYRQYDRFVYCRNCALMWFCRGCPAVAKCYTGSFYEKDPQCWHS